ncbi:MAG: YcgL domain-containing protein [Gammaproteobacteria bacterium]|nr:YcgL domain-containing protein [Gammaproteobacteria bacterium]
MKSAIFRCDKKDQMYLYTPYQEDEEAVIEALPEGLLKLTGKLKKVMVLDLTPEQKLARANVNDVIASITEKGYYLQYPPNEILRQDESMLHNPSDSF